MNTKELYHEALDQVFNDQLVQRASGTPVITVRTIIPKDSRPFVRASARVTLTVDACVGNNDEDGVPAVALRKNHAKTV